MEFESATQLLQYADAYLSSLEGKPPKDAEEARERLRMLLFLRDEMERFHFPNPRFAVMELIRLLQQAIPGMEPEEIQELMPQIRALKYAFDVRKWTYERARAAYIANRAALIVLEYGALRDILPFLPYGGEYRAMLERIGSIAFLVFRKLLESLGVVEERLEVDVGSGEVRVARGEKGALRDKLSSAVLASSCILRAFEERKEEIEKVVQSIPNIARVEEYERIVRKYDPASFAQRPERLWDLLQELEERGFIRGGEIDPSVLEGLRKKRLVRYKTLREAAWEHMRDVLIRYYLLFPYRMRRNRPLLPGLPPEPPSFLDAEELFKEADLLKKALSWPTKTVGATILVLHGWDTNVVASDVGLTPEDLKHRIETAKNVLKAGERVRRFLEKL